MPERTPFEKAKWINAESVRPKKPGEAPWTPSRGEIKQHSPIKNTLGIALFMKKITVKGLKSAVINATALGVFDLYINGKRVGREENGQTVFDELKPGWTFYKKRALYYTYDIKDYLKEGSNTILAAVTKGWWGGKISFHTYPKNHPVFLSEILIEDSLGQRCESTGKTWSASWGSAVRAADIWDGELYDANYPSLKDISKKPSLVKWTEPGTEKHDITLSPHFGPTVTFRKDLELKPVSVTIFDGIEKNGTKYGKIHVVSKKKTAPFSLKKGEKAVVDLGQNHTGVPCITVSGKQGVTVQLRTGEMLNDTGSVDHGNDAPAGTVYSSNLRDAFSKAYYVLSGNGKNEKYMPHYAFFGYRYLEIAATDDISVKLISSNVMGSDIRETGSIQTSSSDVNKLLLNILWGQRSNYLSVPTDCPQRNERLGWTGDTQAFCGTAAYNADVLMFLRKWLQDARDSQTDDGQYPDCIPKVNIFGEGAAAWGDAGIIVPYKMWLMYGDTEVISEHYDSMEKYMAWLDSRGMSGPKAVYCDWLSVEDTDGAYISVVYYAYDAHIMSVMSDAIGKHDRAEHYRKLENRVKKHFRSVYCDENGDLKKEHDSQTCYLLALTHGLLLAKNRAKAIKRLKTKIIGNGHHLSTGFIGTSIICEVLSEIGETDLAYSLLTQKEMPSWLYSVTKGATTIWERWDSFTDERGFVVYGVDSSFNHYSYGAFEEWMYRHVAGIMPTDDNPGFSHPVLCPEPDMRKESDLLPGQEKIHWIKCRFDSPSGMIEADWSTENGFDYTVTTPVPSTVILPRVTSSDTFTINGTEHSYSEFPEGRKGSVVIEVAPGTYCFQE